MKLLALVLALAPLSAAATIYKWTDEDGRVVFANRPPEAGAKNVQVLKIDDTPASPAAVNRELEQRVARLERELQQARQYASSAPATPPVPYPAPAPTMADYYAPTYGTPGYGYGYPMYGYPVVSYPVFGFGFPFRRTFVHRGVGFVRGAHFATHTGGFRR